MPDRPLLLFPTYERVQASRRFGGPTGVHRPSGQRQGERLSPKFAELQAAFEARRLEVQQAAAGIDPEQVLVFETVGGIEEFVRAVKHIDGFEWMGELEVEDIAPDEDFFIEGSSDKPLSGRFYLLLTNQRALSELMSLWTIFQTDEVAKFPRNFGRFKELFKCLKDVRRWGIQDRLIDTSLLEYWEADLRRDNVQTVRFEAELWYRSSESKRAASFASVAAQITGLGGRVVSQCTIGEIAYHGLLGELPADAVRAIAGHPTIQAIQGSPTGGLATSDSVMFLRPVGQMAVGTEPQEGDFSSGPEAAPPLPTGNPVVALLDGVPMQHHELLADRLIYDDPDDFESDYQAGERVHGTAMASLLIHGDVSVGGAPLRSPVYVRPILKPDAKARGFVDPIPEAVPEDVLVVDLLHQAVKRMVEGDGQGQPATAPSVKIVNLSIGDLSRQFQSAMSPLSRLIDWLSHHYGLLFIISAGNHSSVLELPMTRTEFEALPPNERESQIVKFFKGNARNRRLRPPAESINSLTIGAAHSDGSTVVHVANRFDPYTGLLPSPFSAFGSGYRRGIKPDIVFPGGRQWYLEPLVSGNPLQIKPSASRAAPGIRVASPSAIVGELDKTIHQCGTSHATALISRSGVICFDTLQEVFSTQPSSIDPQPFIGPLLKAMLVHGCSWGDVGNRLEGILSANHSSKEIKSWISRWLGYGLPDIQRVQECNAQRATLLGFGSLGDDQAHAFRLPLPPSLSAVTHVRRLTVTLAWFTPVMSTTQKYRGAKLWFESKHGITEDRQDADWQAVRRGTIQHEVFEGDQAVPFADGETIKIQVNCAKDAGEFTAPIAYGLAVSLEVAENVNVAVYDEVKARVAVPVQVQQRVQGSRT